MKFKTLARSTERAFTSADTMFRNIYGNQQLEKRIFSGSHETSVISTQFVIDTQSPLTITGKFIDNKPEPGDSLGLLLMMVLLKGASIFDLEDRQLVSSNAVTVISDSQCHRESCIPLN